MTTNSMNFTISLGADLDNATTTTAASGSGGGPPPTGYYQEQAENMWTYIPPIITVWGTIGNMLTLVILIRQFRRLSSTAMYLFALGISDLMILWLGPLRKWLQYIREEDVRKLTPAGCKVQTMLTYATVQMSSWLLAAVTVERMLSVMAPHKVRIICTTTRAGIVIAGIFLTIFALNAHYLWGLEFNLYVPERDRYYDCIGKTEDYRDFLQNIWPWIDFVVAFLFPFCILLTGNAAIIVKLGQRRRQRRKMSHASQLMSSEKETRTINFMLITLSVIFFICMTPVSVYYMYLPAREEKILAIKDPAEQWEAIEYYFFFLPAIVNLIAYINASVNFILYVLSGNKFRAELKALFTCKKSKCDGVFGSSSGTRSSTGRTSNNTRTSYLASSDVDRQTDRTRDVNSTAFDDNCTNSGDREANNVETAPAITNMTFDHMNGHNYIERHGDPAVKENAINSALSDIINETGSSDAEGTNEERMDDINIAGLDDINTASITNDTTVDKTDSM